MLENILKTTQKGKTQVAALYKKMALGVFSDVNIVALQQSAATHHSQHFAVIWTYDHPATTERTAPRARLLSCVVFN